MAIKLFTVVNIIPAMSSSSRSRRGNLYGAWLAAMFLLVIIMLVVGGLTRLTESGLSIVEWKVVMDIMPPLHPRDWERLFALYQKTEQYRQLGDIFSMADFQKIFWWEYSHRLLARLLALLLVVGLLALLLTGGWRRLSRGQVVGLLLLFLLGGAQGLVGKWMVASGLFTRASVMPMTLVAHFCMAFIILFLLYGLWAASRDWRFTISPLRFLLLASLFLTLLLGSLTAGAKAGYAYGTWPLMGDSFIPIDYWWRGAPDDVGFTTADVDSTLVATKNTSRNHVDFFHNAVINPSAIQFHHRLMAYVSFALVVVYFLLARRPGQGRRWVVPSPLGASLLLLLVLLQIFLGVMLVVNVVPMGLAMFHQWVGTLIMLMAFSLQFVRGKRR